MKKLVVFSVTLAVACLAEATTINVSTPRSLDGYYAYTMGVQMNVPSGQQLNSMTISFDNVQLTSAPQGYLYVDLLNLNSPGLNSIVDRDQPGDAFASLVNGGQGVSLAVKQFNYWYQTMSFSISLNADQLAALSSYAQDGIFDISLDPDCWYRFSGSCQITYNCNPLPPQQSVPDNGWTVAMLGLPLIGFALLRRKLVLS